MKEWLSVTLTQPIYGITNTLMDTNSLKQSARWLTLSGLYESTSQGTLQLRSNIVINFSKSPLSSRSRGRRHESMRGSKSPILMKTRQADWSMAGSGRVGSQTVGEARGSQGPQLI